MSLARRVAEYRAGEIRMFGRSEITIAIDEVFSKFRMFWLCSHGDRVTSSCHEILMCAWRAGVMARRVRAIK